MSVDPSTPSAMQIRRYDNPSVATLTHELMQRRIQLEHCLAQVVFGPAAHKQHADVRMQPEYLLYLMWPY